MDNCENEEHENHATLKSLNKELDSLWHRVETDKGQPTETINCLEHELHRLSLALHSSAPLDPLMMYFNNTWKPYVLLRSKPIL